jgi:hypothetical protein
MAITATTEAIRARAARFARDFAASTISGKVLKMVFGNMPNDGGHLLLSQEDEGGVRVLGVEE